VSRTFKNSPDVRCEVLVTVTVKDTISCDVTPFSLVKVYKYFEEMYCLDLQTQAVNQVWEVSLVDICLL
jgi:hypothetical protein